MKAYMLVVEYNGSRYSGFQRQKSNSQLSMTPQSVYKKRSRDDKRKKNVPRTIQDCLEEALAQWTGLAIPALRLRCAGRTDKGVHATGQVVAVDINGSNVMEGLEEWQMRRAINSRLYLDVSVKSIASCDPSFDPRHDAIRKQYTYTIRFRRLVLGKDGQPLAICGSGPQTLRNPHDEACLWLCPWPLDDSDIKGICRALAGKHDFSCFVHKGERRKKVNVIELEKFNADYLNVSEELAPTVNLRFTLEACGFRRSMVRNLVGFIVDVCRGLLSQDDIPKVLTGSDNGAAIVNSAPASGLCLTQVVYK